MTRSSDTSLFGDKELDAVGEPVSAITLDSNVVLLVGQHREHEFRIENDITVENHGNGSSFSVRYDPYNRDDPIRENLTELASIIGDYDAIVIRSATKLTAELIRAGVRLKVIGRAGVGGPTRWRRAAWWGRP